MEIKTFSTMATTQKAQALSQGTCKGCRLTWIRQRCKETTVIAFHRVHVTSTHWADRISAGCLQASLGEFLRGQRVRDASAAIWSKSPNSESAKQLPRRTWQLHWKRRTLSWLREAPHGRLQIGVSETTNPTKVIPCGRLLIVKTPKQAAMTFTEAPTQSIRGTKLQSTAELGTRWEPSSLIELVSGFGQCRNHAARGNNEHRGQNFAAETGKQHEQLGAES